MILIFRSFSRFYRWVIKVPILKILIDDEETEFRILPLNKLIMNNIMNRYVNNDGIIDRPGFLSHVVKAPKLSRKEWANLPSSMITKIMRNITYYTDSVFKKEMELRTLSTQMKVCEDELDDLFRYLSDDTDDWAWDRVNKLEEIIDNLKDKINKINNSLEHLKEDKVIFEEGKEIDYDVQSLQLEDK